MKGDLIDQSEKCRTCYYSANLHRTELSYCDYASITGHCRILITPGGDECTVWKPKRKKRNRHKKK